MSAVELIRGAVLSDDGMYRYRLTRRWGDGSGPHDVWIMLNPSTADAAVDDPTIRRCVGFSRSWGADGIVVVNLFALRATNPAELVRHPDPIGRDNDAEIGGAVAAATSQRGRIIAAWGDHRMARTRSRDVTGTIVRRVGRGRITALGLTHGGAPRHPLYMPSDTILRPWGPQ